MFFFVFTPFIKGGRYIRYSLLPFLFYPHFNVTCFLKVGITISFFELYAFVFFFLVLIHKPQIVYKINYIDRFFLLFLLFSLLSILVAIFRIYIVEDLTPSFYFNTSPILRGLMSLNRFIVYPIILMGIRSFYESKNFDVNSYFLKYLAYSGLFPAIASLLQAAHVDFQLLFNNPSFNMDIGWSNVGRPLGLTNEASFFCFMIFFSVLGVYYAKKNDIITSKKSIILYIIYVCGVFVSISRTGLLVLALFYILKNIRKFTIKKISFVLIMLLLLSTLSFSGFNLLDRFTSSFDVNADISTIERYGSTEALLNLAISKCLLFGVGIFNYSYYIYNFLPDYAVTYSIDVAIPSFNLILQLWAEWGLPLIICFICFFYRLFKRNCSSFVIDWFFYLAIFALSFQIFNFSLPFIIILFSFERNNVGTCLDSDLLKLLRQ